MIETMEKSEAQESVTRDDGTRRNDAETIVPPTASSETIGIGEAIRRHLADASRARPAPRDDAPALDSAPDSAPRPKLL